MTSAGTIATLSELGVQDFETSSTEAIGARHTLTGDQRVVRFFLTFNSGDRLTVILVGSGNEPVWLWRVMDAIKRLCRLPSNWDSYAATPLTAEAVRRSLTVLPSILPNDAPNPSVVPTRDGGLQFEWHRRGIDLEIRVPPTGPTTADIANESTGDDRSGPVDRDAVRAAIRLMFSPAGP